MKLSDYTISTIIKFFADSYNDNDILGLTPYMSGTKLVEFFNKAGCRDIYNEGMPDGLSRPAYVQDRLKGLSGTVRLVTIIENLFDTRHFSTDRLKDIDFAVLEFNKLIAPDGYSLEKINEIYKIIGADPPEEIEIEVHFEDIENQILEQIKNAKFLIWVAVAWFTNKKLASALWHKANAGINVRIIVCQDKTTEMYGLDYEKIGETKRIKPDGLYGNDIMHHKFCIIDMKTVIRGSYNWTNKANWNREDVEVNLNSRELAEQYAERFIKLING